MSLTCIVVTFSNYIQILIPSGRIQQESSTEFNASLQTCEKALDELDEESLLNFSAVGSTVMEVQEQLDDIQVRRSKWD